MQLLAKFKKFLYMEFRATLNFLKFKVALNPMYRMFLQLCQTLHLILLIKILEAGAEAPLLVIKISKKTSSALEVFLNETKQKLILHENIHATRE